MDTAACLECDVHPFAVKFRLLWSDNGNNLSVQYSGTESTTSGITKDGKEGFLGAISSGLKSVNRFFINNFGDDFKQQCIDVLLGRDTTVGTEDEKGYIEVTPINMFVGSWNVGGEMPDTSIDLDKWLGAKMGSDLPYFYIPSHKK